MQKKLVPLAIATVLASVIPATGLAAGSTQVTHVSFTKPAFRQRSSDVIPEHWRRRQ